MKEVSVIMQSLKIMRSARGVSPQEITMESGISASQLSQIESGNLNIRLSTFLRYLDAIRVKITFGYITRGDQYRKVKEISFYDQAKEYDKDEST